MSDHAMTIGQYARARVAGTVRSWLGNWPMSEFPRVFGSGPTSTGISVSEFSALNYSAVWSAVSVVSADVASLPLVLYKRTPNGGKERHTDAKLYELLHDAPNPEMSSMVFREALQAHAMTWGNAYAEIQRDELQRPVALWPITPDRVTPFRDEGTRQLRYRVSNVRGAQSVIAPRNMLHVPGLGFDGVMGYSVINQARESISLGLATEAFGGTFFGNGATFGGHMSHPSNLTTEVKQGIRESVDAMHTGVGRAHKFLITGGGMKYERFGIPPNDAQFLETRAFQVTEVARWFQIPPHKIGDLSRATFSNIEQQDIEYYRSCLRRWLVRWEQELTRKLISPLERRQQFIRHNAEGFLRGDSAARATFYREMFNIGAYSINMILESEDLNKIGPEGDVHFVQGNLSPADKAMEGPQKPPAVTVTDVTKPKELLPGTEDDEDEDDRRGITVAINAITAAIATTLDGQRDALSQAEHEQHQQAVTRLEEERARLQQLFDAYRERHAAEAEALQAVAEAARQEAATARAAVSATEHAASVAAETARTVVEAAERRAGEGTRAAEEAFQAQMKESERAAVEEGARRVQEATALAAAALTDAAARQAEADQRREAAEQAERDAAGALVTQRQEEADRLTGMLAAHRALVVDAMERMIAPEVDRARKHQATPEKLRTWIESFYVTYEDKCLDTLRPAMRAHLAWKQSADDVEAVTVALVREHIAESQRQLLAVANGEPEEMHADLDRMLQRWERDRPAAVADRIVRDEVDHVRTR